MHRNLRMFYDEWLSLLDKQWDCNSNDLAITITDLMLHYAGIFLIFRIMDASLNNHIFCKLCHRNLGLSFFQVKQSRKANLNKKYWKTQIRILWSHYFYVMLLSSVNYMWIRFQSNIIQSYGDQSLSVLLRKGHLSI